MAGKRGPKMANQILDDSDQNDDLVQEYNEALKRAREIIEQQKAKLQLRISEVNKKRAKRNNDNRKRLTRDKKNLENILKLMKDEDKSGESEEEDEDLDDISEARELLINGLIDVETSNHVRVKIMGNLESTPFYNAVKRHTNKENALHIALNKCELWTERIRDSDWHPFKTVTAEGESTEIVDDGDKKLKTLKMEMGEKVHNAVVKALTEINQYNPIFRRPVRELWNFREGRKATLKEGIASVLNHSKQRK